MQSSCELYHQKRQRAAICAMCVICTITDSTCYKFQINLSHFEFTHTHTHTHTHTKYWKVNPVLKVLNRQVVFCSSGVNRPFKNTEWGEIEKGTRDKERVQSASAINSRVTQFARRVCTVTSLCSGWLQKTPASLKSNESFMTHLFLENTCSMHASSYCSVAVRCKAGDTHVR